MQTLVCFCNRLHHWPFVFFNLSVFKYSPPSGFIFKYIFFENFCGGYCICPESARPALHFASFCFLCSLGSDSSKRVAEQARTMASKDVGADQKGDCENSSDSAGSSQNPPDQIVKKRKFHEAFVLSRSDSEETLVLGQFTPPSTPELSPPRPTSQDVPKLTRSSRFTADALAKMDENPLDSSS